MITKSLIYGSGSKRDLISFVAVPIYLTSIWLGLKSTKINTLTGTGYFITSLKKNWQW